MTPSYELSLSYEDSFVSWYCLFLFLEHVPYRSFTFKYSRSLCSMYVQVRTYSQKHFYMETQTALAVPDEDGCMNVYTSCQAPDMVQMVISTCLNLPLHNIRVITRRLGGGFGGKVLQNLKVLFAHIRTGGCGGSSSVYDEFIPKKIYK